MIDWTILIGGLVEFALGCGAGIFWEKAAQSKREMNRTEPAE